MPTDQELNAQKAALLSAIAQQGSQGQAAFAGEQARRQEAQKAAVGQIVSRSQMTGAGGSAPAAFTQELIGAQNNLGSIYAQDAALSQQAFKNSIGATSAANAAYMDQARAGLPVVQAQTQGIIAQIRADQAEAQAQREEAAREREFRDQEREYERQQREEGNDEEAIGANQEMLLEDAAVSANPIVNDALQGIVGVASTPANALKLAPKIIDQVVQGYRDERGDPDAMLWTKKDKAQLYRYIYQYYSKPGTKAPTDPSRLGEAFAKEGADPTMIPGYVSPQERIQQQKEKQAAEREANTDEGDVLLVQLSKNLSSDEMALLQAFISRTGVKPKSVSQARRMLNAEWERGRDQEKKSSPGLLDRLVRPLNLIGP